MTKKTCIHTYIHTYINTHIQQLIADGVILDDEDEEEWDDGLELDLPSTHKKLGFQNLPNTRQKIGLKDPKSDINKMHAHSDSFGTDYTHRGKNGANLRALAGNDSDNLSLGKKYPSRGNGGNGGNLVQRKGLPLFLQWGYNDRARDKVLDQYKAFTG